MIKRIWHGYTTPERADEYEALLKAEVIDGIEAKAILGFRKIEVLRRPLGDEVEFVTIMEFDDLDSVKAFVGEDYEQAYVPDAARAILSRFDERSQHYEVEEVRSYDAEPILVEETDSVENAANGFMQEEDAAEQVDPAAAAHETLPGAAAFEGTAPAFITHEEAETTPTTDEEATPAFAAHENSMPGASASAANITEPADDRYETAPVIDAVPVVEPAEESLVSEEPVLAASEETAQAPAQETAPAEPAPLLAPDKWFVRKDRGNGSVPATREGYRVVARFIFGMIFFGLVAGAMLVAAANGGPDWLRPAALAVFVLGSILAAAYFIISARRHTEPSMTFSEYRQLARQTKATTENV